MSDPPDRRRADSTRAATHVKPPETPRIPGLATLALGVTTVAALYFGREVLIPITLAILLSFLVAPLANLLCRLKLGPVASVFVAVVISVSVLVLLGSVIANQMTDLAAGVPRYQATIEKKFDAAHGLTIGKLDRFLGAAGRTLQRVTTEPSPPSSESASTSPAAQPPAALPAEVREPAPTP